MIKKLSMLLLLSLGLLWAQDEDESDSKKADRLARKKYEEEQRLDEYANSLRRRDWLKDRLVLEMGLGSKFPVMGETGFGFGFGAEYITRWHVGAFATYGFIPSSDDEAFDGITLDGGTGYRAGLSYYLFPKNPLHVGLLASYGTVYFDHDQAPDVGGVRPLISNKGYEVDLTITYLTDQWYFLQFIAGMYYVGDKLPGTTNDTWVYDVDEGNKSRVVDKGGIPNSGLIFGAGIGFALPEFFPDDTEKRRRDRETKQKI
jgi:hypothetical protein